MVKVWLVFMNTNDHEIYDPLINSQIGSPWRRFIEWVDHIGTIYFIASPFK